jgi:hypothetical protein
MVILTIQWGPRIVRAIDIEACSRRERTNIHICVENRCHLMEGILMPTDKILRQTFQPQQQKKNSHTLLKHHGEWWCSALPTRPRNDNFGTDVKSVLTASSSQKIWNWYCCGWILTKSWIQKMYRTSYAFQWVFTCLHMINDSGDILYRSWQMLLEFWAGQIGGSWLFWIFDQDSKWKLHKLWIPNS